jgi:hypothetical protein
VNAQQVANQIAFKEAVGKYNIRRIFTFHRSVAEAKLFTEKGSEGICTQLPDFNAFHVNGKMSTAVRERIMHEFKDSDLSVISNARCLTEGVDLPAVDMVAFMSPKKSKVDIIQATGRAMRKDPHNPDKILGYILVPLYLEITTDESVEGAVEKADFGEIWNVLQALQEQDDVLTDIIRQMQEDKGKYGKPKSSKLGDKVETIGIDISLETLKESITALSIEKLGFAWDLRYGELIKYKDQFGDCNIPSNWGENQQLVNWVRTQRTNYKNKQLSKDQVKRLENIGFAWDPIWEKMFDTLKEYKKNHGDCNVVCNRQEDNKLVDWVNRQRMFYLTKKLSDERIKRLECIDFVWDPVWEEMFDTLKEYKKNHGDTNVPSKWPEDKKLANWVYRQRGFYLDQQLSKDQVKRLENIGFVWDPIWEEMFDTLKEYKNVYGDCNVPSKWPENEKFATWVYIQHHRYRIGLLGVNRIKRLEEMGFLWGQFERIWEEMFNALREYKKNHGDCNVPQNWEEYKLKLGQWVRHQRLSYRIRKLSDGQIKCLEDIGFVWDPIWEKMFKILKEYEKNHGNCNVFENNQKDEKLAIWANTQRRMYKKGELNCDHIKRLEGIGFVWEKTDLFYSEGWEDGDQKRWSEIFDVLKEYKNVYGDCNVPSQWPEDVELASWVYIQRALYRNKTLSNECIKHLEGINFTWDPIFVLDPIWEETLYDLKEYRRNYGDCNVPKNWTDQQLANWVETQRQSYQIGELDYNRIRCLERINFVWDPLEAAWQKMLYKLKEYKKYHGDCNVPKHWTENKQLANWVDAQRIKYCSQELSDDCLNQLEDIDFDWTPPLEETKEKRLREDHIQHLEDIGFNWDKHKINWQERFAKLKEYKEVHGTCNVPTDWPDRKLVNWVNTQRTKYKKGELSYGHIKRLDEISFEWPFSVKKIDNERDEETRKKKPHRLLSKDGAESWKDMFDTLKEYKKEHGDCNISFSWNKQLATWVSAQRSNYRRRKLRDDRIKLLDDIGFEWASSVKKKDEEIWESRWKEKFDLLKEYKKEYGDCNVQRDWRDRQLVNWMVSQRTRYRNKKLNEERIKLLEEIGFEWNPYNG